KMIMDISLFARGIVIGLSIAAPVGPIGIICIRRSLSGGFAAGFAAGMGAATADLFYALVAVAGMASVAEFLSAGKVWLHLIGGAFLCYLAWGVLRSAKPEEGNTESAEDAGAPVESQASLALVFMQTFALTLTNPMTILSFAALLSVFQLSSVNARAFLLIAGVFAGSALWWLTLSCGTALCRASLDKGGRALAAINYASAAILGGFGIFAILTR
ncbi:MAG TPA: LysE family transporter, partial [Chroococcales cyanobacterium]